MLIYLLSTSLSFLIIDLVRTRLTVMTNDMKASQNGKSFGGILPTMFKIVEKEGEEICLYLYVYTCNVHMCIYTKSVFS